MEENNRRGSVFTITSAIKEFPDYVKRESKKVRNHECPDSRAKKNEFMTVTVVSCIRHLAFPIASCMNLYQILLAFIATVIPITVSTVNILLA